MRTNNEPFIENVCILCEIHSGQLLHFIVQYLGLISYYLLSELKNMSVEDNKDSLEEIIDEQCRRVHELEVTTALIKGILLSRYLLLFYVAKSQRYGGIAK